MRALSRNYPGISQTAMTRLLHVLIMGLLTYQHFPQWLLGTAWLCLTAVIMFSPVAQLRTVYFFGAIFASAGILHNPYFTLKHYQAAFVLVLTLHALQGTCLDYLKSGLKASAPLKPLYLCIATIFISGVLQHNLQDKIFTFLNLLFIIVSVVYFLGMLTRERPDAGDLIRYYLLGVILCIFAAMLNTMTGHDWMRLPLIHNNHMGVQSAFTIFLCFCLLAAPAAKSVHLFHYSAAAILFAGILLSCSRTAYISLFITFFILLAFAYTSTTFSNAAYRIKLLAIPLTLIPAAYAGMLLTPSVFARISSFLLDFLNPDAWRWTFADHANFGFFGKFRLHQIHELRDILQSHFFLGAGFIQQTLDFHGLYFVLLGSGGIVGLSLFLYFIARMVMPHFGKPSPNLPAVDAAAHSATIFALISWSICSLTETFFFQFSIWIIILSSVWLSHPNYGPRSYPDKVFLSSAIQPVKQASQPRVVIAVWLLITLLLPVTYNFLMSKDKCHAGISFELAVQMRGAEPKSVTADFYTEEELMREKQLCGSMDARRTREGKLLTSITFANLFFLFLYLFMREKRSLKN